MLINALIYKRWGVSWRTERLSASEYSSTQNWLIRWETYLKLFLRYVLEKMSGPSHLVLVYFVVGNKETCKSEKADRNTVSRPAQSSDRPNSPAACSNREPQRCDVMHRGLQEQRHYSHVAWWRQRSWRHGEPIERSSRVKDDENGLT